MKKSHISKKEIPKDIREGIFNLIKKDFPDFRKEDFICLTELIQYRRLYLTSLICLVHYV